MEITKRIEAIVKGRLAQGLDVTKSGYSTSVARLLGVSVDVVAAVIASVGGAARIVDAETVAQERLAEDRRARHTAAYRTANHEEI